MADQKQEKLRLGGMALRNGLLIHGPTHWAAAARKRDGGIEVASERNPELAPELVAKMPGLRGPVKLADASGKASVGANSNATRAEVQFEGLLASTGGPWDSIVNAHPAAQSEEELRTLPRVLLSRYLGKAGEAVSGLPLMERLVWSVVRWPRAGRLYAFLATRPR